MFHGPPHTANSLPDLNFGKFAEHCTAQTLQKLIIKERSHWRSRERSLMVLWGLHKISLENLWGTFSDGSPNVFVRKTKTETLKNVPRRSPKGFKRITFREYSLSITCLLGTCEYCFYLVVLWIPKYFYCQKNTFKPEIHLISDNYIFMFSK